MQVWSPPGFNQYLRGFCEALENVATDADLQNATEAHFNDKLSLDSG